MKKIYSLVFLLLASFTCSYGKSVPVSTAKTVGYNFLHQKIGYLKIDDLNLTYTSKGTSDYFYAFSSTGCFVIVSAEDGVIPIIGYSTDRPFIGDNVPSNVKGFFEDYNKQINYIQTKQIAASPEIAATWDNLIKNKNITIGAKTTVVAPLLSTTWNQSPYYNDNCPYDVGAGARCVTGCVATATAQVMKFWSWPTTGTGLHSYTTTSYGTLSANYGTTTYNWSAMPNNVTSPNAAVARLMSDVGISVNMDYTPTESSAYVISSGSPITNCAEYALKTYFNYDPALHGESRASYSDATWIGMLEGDLNVGHPVIYTGTGTSGGHCFVLDGYDASNNFHVNWGWGGSGPDGYYSINAMNPPALGTGGGAGGFNSDQTAILGVKPSTTGCTATLQLYDYVNLSASTINYFNPFTVTTNVENTGSTTFNGDFCAAAFDASTGAFISYIDSVVGTSLPSGYIFSSPLTFNTAGVIAMLPGSYTIGILYRIPGCSWVAVPNASPYTNFVPMDVVNHNFIELYSPMSAAPNPLVQGSPATVTLTAYNGDISTWNDSLYLGVYNMDGTPNCDIQSLPATSIAPSTATGTLTFTTPNVTAAPGTYLLVFWFKYSGNWYLAGADYDTNPIFINVVAPPPSPDIYEVNNTAATAYDLTPSLSWVSNVASTSTPGANFHVVTDQDYYKIVLAPGYNYALTANVSDDISPGSPYTVDAVWSYSTDGGTNWSPVYNNTMTGTIGLSGGTGGTVIFHVSPHFAGDIGTYKLNVPNITRTLISYLPQVDLSAVKIYPNPAKDFVTIDLTNTGTQGSTVTLTDVEGRKVYSSGINQPIFSLPLNDFANGMYFLQVTTDAGMINRKITVNK